MTLAIPENTTLNLGDSSRWHLRESVTLNAYPRPGGEGYNPINEWFSSYSFSSPILSIQLASNDGGTQNLMGRLLQYQNLLPGGNTQVSLASRRLWRGTQLVRFDQDIEGNYRIRILPRFYLHNITWLIYEFN